MANKLFTKFLNVVPDDDHQSHLAHAHGCMPLATCPGPPNGHYSVFAYHPIKLLWAIVFSYEVRFFVPNLLGYQCQKY
jgi:hypothetical protein